MRCCAGQVHDVCITCEQQRQKVLLVMNACLFTRHFVCRRERCAVRFPKAGSVSFRPIALSGECADIYCEVRNFYAATRNITPDCSFETPPGNSTQGS